MLSGLRVVDLSTTMAGALATLVLAESGADVVMVEPPGGSAQRDVPGFRTWGRSKRSVELDLGSAPGRQRLDELLSGADVLVHGYGPQQAASLGLDDPSLRLRHPSLVVASVLAWPMNHALADAPVDDLLMLARLGVLDEQIGARGESPIYVRFPLGSHSSAWLAVIGVLARLIDRLSSGQGGAAHTSLAQGALVPMMMHWRACETPSPSMRIGMPKNAMRASLFECGDGRWIHIMPPPPDTTPLMQAVFAEMGPAAVAAENAAHAGLGIDTWSNWGAIVAAFRRRPVEAWLEHLWANDIPAQEAVGLGEVFSDEQAKVNRYVVEIDDPQVGPISAAGLPLTLDPPMRVRWAVDAMAADDAMQWSRPAWPRAVPTGSAGDLPLAGLRVLDLGNFLAGPLGPMLMADLGATVIKLEPASGDPMRHVEWAFAGCQRGKRAVALDLKSPASRPALDALVGWADVVHHNLRLSAARRLGLDAAAVAAHNPNAVFCHVSSYGPEGPRAGWPGYDQMFQASCGWEVMGAGEGNPPMWHRFGFMDHLCAMSSVAATLIAVLSQRRGEPVVSVAASLLGAGVLTNAESYRCRDGTLAPVAMLDAAQTMTAIGRRIVQASDGWVAISSDDSAAVLDNLGATSDDVDAKAAAMTVDSLTAMFDSAGLACSKVFQGQDVGFFADEDHIAAGLVASYDHAEYGELHQPGAFWYFGDRQLSLDRAHPVLGQHTAEVLAEIGIDAQQIDELLAAGVAVQGSTAS